MRRQLRRNIFISPRHEGHQQTACGGTAQHVQNHCYPNTRVHMDEIHADVAQDQWAAAENRQQTDADFVIDSSSHRT